MKSKKNIFIAVFFVLITLCSLIIHAVLVYRDGHFSCRSSMTYFTGNSQLTTKFKFVFNGRTGEFSSLGEYREAGKKDQKISQLMKFNYIRVGDDMVLVSTQSNLSDSQIKSLKNIVPDFYLRKDRGLNLHLFRQGDHGYVFINNDIPTFICTRI